MFRRLACVAVTSVLSAGLGCTSAEQAPATASDCNDSAPCSTGGANAAASLGKPNAAAAGATSLPVDAPSGEGGPMGLAGPGALAPDGASVRGPDAGGAAAVAPDAGGGALDRCDVGVLDPSRPPSALTLSGNLGAHDPVIIAAEGRYHYFSTGNGIAAKTSPDLLTWRQEPDVFAETPAWFLESVPAYEPRNIWAPDIAYFGGQYHLYYSVSSFGSNRSCIGHATRASLGAGSWQDHEAMFCSNAPGQIDDYNAIDPNVILDQSGAPWMAFGSFWSGIYLIGLNAEGEWAGGEVLPLASRGGGSIEAPFIVRRCGFYYLFVSFGACCQGVNSTYETRVGRSRDLLGPYVDREGVPMLQGGGTLLLERGGDWVGPGHNAVLIDGQRAYNVYHAYAASNGASQLRISELAWDADGWVVSGGP
jgi:arabinan endo-1,5-alpha-L-arabinosidase